MSMLLEDDVNTSLAALAPIETLADLIERLGDVPLARIRFRPFPGTATEQDVLEAEASGQRLCELVDGALVEKPMGYPESVLASILINVLMDYVTKHRAGAVSGESGMMRMLPGLVRIPDVAFISAARRPKDLASQRMAPLAPDLAIEVLSPSNTPREIARKLQEYFQCGTLIAWVIDPVARTCDVYRSPDGCETLTANDTLVGGEVLPGFSIQLSAVFAELDEQLGTHE